MKRTVPVPSMMYVVGIFSTLHLRASVWFSSHATGDVTP